MGSNFLNNNRIMYIERIEVTMEMLSVLETLEDMIERSLSVPFVGKCLVDKEEVLELVKEIRLKLPDDIKQAKWVKEERQRILLEAQKEADTTIKDAENRVSEFIDEHEITKHAYEQANEIIANAQKTARDIRLGTREYADSVLKKIEEILIDAVTVIKTNRDEFK